MAQAKADRIEKQIHLRAPRSRVWRALSDAQEFGSKEPTTLVVFELEDAAGGTMLKVVESGFDKIPLERRAKAFQLNDEGWGMQMKAIEKHVAQAK